MVAQQAHNADTDLADLETELRRLTRRADRQKRRIKLSTEAWQRWSATIQEGLGIVGRIERAPIRDMVGLTTKFRAILWRIQVDEDVILDEAVRRALKRFGRDVAALMRQLAGDRTTAAGGTRRR